MSASTIPIPVDARPVSSPARRWLVPSLTDLLAVIMLLWLFAGASSGWSRLLSDGDTGLHVRIGDYMLDHQEVLRKEVFSWGKVGQPWVAFEWLSQVLFAGLHRVDGLRALVFCTAVVLILSFILMLRSCLARGSDGLLALFATLMAVNALMIHFLVRPHIFTFLLLITTHALIAADRREQSRRLWWLVPLSILWANLHPGFAILFPYLILLVVGLVAESLVQPDQRAKRLQEAKRYALLGALCLAASLVNPFGWHLHQHVVLFNMETWPVQLVDEFRSPQFRSEQMMILMVFLFAGIGLSGILLRERRVVEPLWIGAFAYLALRSVRHSELYLAITVPILTAELSHRLRQINDPANRRSVLAALLQLGSDLQRGFRAPTVWCAVGLGLVAVLTPADVWPQDFPTKYFPTKLIERQRERMLHSRVLTHDQWGDYLVYRNYPQQKIFIDGRHDYYGEHLIHDYLGILRARHDWRSLLAKYRVDAVLCERETPLASLLRMDSDWRLVDESPDAVLFELAVKPEQAALR